jgi:hypothetical protein
MNATAKAILDGITAIIFLWLAWRTLSTGRPAGSPTMKSRDEGPQQFWVALSFFVLLGIGNILRAAGLW